MTYFRVAVLTVSLCYALAYDFTYPNKNEVTVKCESAEAQNYIRIGEHHYYIGRSQASWIEAAHLCRQYGGDLALIESAAEMNAISKYLLEKGYGNDDNFWISGDDFVSTHKFMSLTNGLQLPFTDWSAGQPDYPGREHCVHLWLRSSTYKMNNNMCERKLSFICKRQSYTRCRDIY
ncbi:C-type lectin 37Db [Drosophila grimshawi]|uniref:GH13620 n=1 Tax=Drosophila grimshawi TaxID=7222 RepID=B4JTT9_DROGR|nr:C-type lectin 37Db [Drosophila grimshawi]EDV91518.1 GH13620 [Drosophila grimshawi]